MAGTTDRIEDVLVVGGGDSGLLTALCIERLNPGVDVRVVDDFSADPPEVGKSTYREIVDILHEFVDLDERRFIREVKPVWKASVYFRDWTGYEFHYPFDDLKKYPDLDSPDCLEKNYLLYHEFGPDPDYATKNELMVEQQLAPVSYDATSGGYPRYVSRAYQLDLRRFNSFLRTVARERDIALIDDVISSVETGAGEIERLFGERSSYQADLYVDATGFSRLLASEVDAEFHEFALPLDSAVHAKTERDLAEIDPATVIESGDHGWFWQIDTFEFRDRGYVYASEFVSEADAVAEFVDHCEFDPDPDDLETYEFTSGFYERTWTGNCVSIGNAAGFVEPLQSTGLTANAQSAQQLAHLLAAMGRYDPPAARSRFNAWTNRMWQSIYDFVSLHYAHAAGETPFWETVQSLDRSDRVERIEDHYDRCGHDTKLSPFLNPDVCEPPLVDPAVFPLESYFTLLRNMDVESTFYENLDIDVDDEVRTEMRASYEENRDTIEEFLDHQEFYQGILFETPNSAV